MWLTYSSIHQSNVVSIPQCLPFSIARLCSLSLYMSFSGSYQLLSLGSLPQCTVCLGPKCNEQPELLCKYPCLFSDIPLQTDWIEHDTDAGDARLIKHQFYRAAPGKHDYLDAEVARSSSSWASPCILVLKQDGTPKFCTDLWKENSHKI